MVEVEVAIKRKLGKYSSGKRNLKVFKRNPKLLQYCLLRQRSCGNQSHRRRLHFKSQESQLININSKSLRQYSKAVRWATACSWALFRIGGDCPEIASEDTIHVQWWSERSERRGWEDTVVGSAPDLLQRSESRAIGRSVYRNLKWPLFSKGQRWRMISPDPFIE